LVAFSEVTVETPEELMFPVTLPVTLPEKPEVAVTTPDATILVKEMFGSRLTVTVLDAADEVKLVPPEIVKDSLRRSIFSEPESPVTVSAVPTAAVVTEVTKPFALTVTTGIKVCEPKDPTLELTVANVVTVFAEVISPDKLGILVVEVAVPVTLPTKPEVAVTIPDALILVAFSEVTVETPEELMFPVTLPVTLPTNPLEEVVIPVTTTPDAFVSNEGELTSPVKFPVTFPTKPLVAVTTPDATILVKEMFGSRLTVTVLDAADEVKLVPPEIVRVSLRRSIFSEPESPVTVSAVPTAAVVTAVTKPLALTVTTGIRVCEPKDPTLELTVANVPVPVTLSVPLNDSLVYAKSPVIAIVLPVAS